MPPPPIPSTKAIGPKGQRIGGGVNFCLDFKNDFCSGAEPLEVFTDLTLKQLKNLYREIQNSSLKLVGYLSYEWGTALENVAPANANDALKLPLNWFGLYEKGTFPYVIRRRIIKGNVPLTFQSSFTKKNYLRAVRKIFDFLKAGDCYQVNLTQRFTGNVPRRGNVPVSAWEIYQRLRQISPAPYAGFIDAGDFQILSASPELFLKANADGTLITKPIKGTRPRSNNQAEDQKLKTELEQSEKDRAELLMITDLLRNDLGKVCIPGSVHVPTLREIESFTQVHHLVSTVTGQRRPDVDIIDCLAAMMPGGSITGAPKIRAMEIIRELEPVNRGIYTGAIGWLGPNNTGHFNIAIRTIVIQKNSAAFNAGGGIVIDSDPEREYEECLTKASGMCQALGLV